MSAAHTVYKHLNCQMCHFRFRQRNRCQYGRRRQIDLSECFEIIQLIQLRHLDIACRRTGNTAHGVHHNRKECRHYDYHHFGQFPNAAPESIPSAAHSCGMRRTGGGLQQLRWNAMESRRTWYSSPTTGRTGIRWRHRTS